jgi:cardiolipin synthase
VNLPNLLTIARIMLVPAVVWLIASGRYQTAFWCFVLAGVTDAADGYLARRLDQRTTLGAYLDAIADKALLVSIFVALGVVGHVPVWFVILVVSRDVMIVGAVLISWLMERPVAIRPLYISKVNTAAQITLAAVVLVDRGFALGLGPLLTFGVVGVALLTASSMAAYLVQWLGHMAEGPPAQGGA